MYKRQLLESVVMSCTQIPVIPEYAYLGILFPVHCHTVYTEWHSHQVLISVIRHQFAFCGKVRQSDLPASAPQAGTVFQQQEPGVERRCGSIAVLQAQFTAFAHVPVSYTHLPVEYYIIVLWTGRPWTGKERP